MKKNRYEAFTLLEMLIVMGIMIILGGMTFASFDGLQNTIKMNEYMLNLEQDIRGVQRASMLLERNPAENWLYGIGIDFTDMNPDGNYTTFKWCSIFGDYGDITTTTKVPGYDLNNVGSTQLPLPEGDITGGTCDSDIVDASELRLLSGYGRTVTMPKATVTFETPARFVLFESVSGRAFFYNEDGELLNYVESDGKLRIVEDDIDHLVITIDPFGGTATRQLTIKHLSGRIDNQVIQ
jgi:type II secretory pathway pseudopilin PulG